MRKISLVLLSVFFVFVGFAQDKYVVLVSMDGFRWDYPQLYNTPNLDKLAKNGVHAQSLIPCFPSKTFPNHYSMATGLYPDHHGIVNNSFYAPEFNESFSLGNMKAKYDPKFYGGDPIWNVAERQGVKAASFFWVGSEVAINGHQPSLWKMYDGSIPFSDRIDTVVSWLRLPERERPRFVMLYFQEPDAISHSTGPYSVQTKAMVQQLDSLVGVLYAKLKALPVGSKVNLIVVSDHGMGEISPSKVVELSSKVKQQWVDQVQADNPMMNIKAKPEFYDSVYNALSSFEHIKAWKSAEVPKRLNYGKNPRDLDFVVVADSLWSITWKIRPNRPKEFIGGTHGYDPDFKQVQGIFYADGPAFKDGCEVSSFENLNVYNIVGKALGIQVPKNDGDSTLLKQIMHLDQGK